MGYQMNPMEAQMMKEALMSGLMTEVDVIMQAYGDYDKHYLGILDKAKFEQRVKRIATISEVYIDMSLMKNDLERRLVAVDDRIAEGSDFIKIIYEDGSAFNMTLPSPACFLPMSGAIFYCNYTLGD